MSINLDLIIGAKNLTGSAFSSLQSQLNKTTGVVGNFRSKLTDIKSALIENQAAQKAVSTEGITGFEGLNSGLLAVAGTIGLVTLAYSKMQSAASSALDAQFERVTDISTLQQTLGVSVEESAKLADLSRKNIAQYGVDLPISVGDVRTANSLILDDYAAALKGKTSNEQIVGITNADAARLGVLRGSLTSSGQAAFSSNISALLSGSTGVGGLNQLAIAQNIQFKNAYLEELKKRGVKDLGKLDPVSKVQAFSAILQASVTDSQIKLLQSTGKAALSSISDKLFDPDVGIFSFARNLAGEGQERRTVVDEFTTTLDLLFGDKGV